ncbi:MAG: hypothetical protein HDR05_12545 [Lachnospiraceae bacterium]|nr:hypothetical protein [Lachnospiraceae bacterium]
MKYAVSVCMLGYTRIQGVVCFDSDTKEFLEITPAVAKRMIDHGQIKGIKWKNTEDGVEFVCDTENWNQQDIPVKTACGKFRPLLNDYPGVQVNSMYTVVRVLDTDYRGRLFEVVSNKCCRVKITENNLRQLATITTIAGCWITDDEVKVADGVIYENRMASAKEEAVEAEIESCSTDTPESKAAETMNDIFSTEGLGGDGEDQSSNEGEEPVAEEEKAVEEEGEPDSDNKDVGLEEEKATETDETAKKGKKTTSKTKPGHGKKSS